MENGKEQEPLHLQITELATMLTDVVNAVLAHNVSYIITRREMPVFMVVPVPEELARRVIPIPGRKKPEAA